MARHSRQHRGKPVEAPRIVKSPIDPHQDLLLVAERPSSAATRCSFSSCPFYKNWRWWKSTGRLSSGAWMRRHWTICGTRKNAKRRGGEPGSESDPAGECGVVGFARRTRSPWPSARNRCFRMGLPGNSASCRTHDRFGVWRMVKRSWCRVQRDGRLALRAASPFHRNAALAAHRLTSRTFMGMGFQSRTSAPSSREFGLLIDRSRRG